MICQRFECGHKHIAHDIDKGCLRSCKCNYFLQTDLMTEVQMIAVWKNRIPWFNADQTAMYGWLRVFENYTHRKAMRLVKS